MEFCYGSHRKLIHHPGLSSDVTLWRSLPDPPMAQSVPLLYGPLAPPVFLHSTYPRWQSLQGLPLLLDCESSEGRDDISRTQHCIPATAISSHALNVCLPNQRIMSKFYLISFLTFQNHQQAKTFKSRNFLVKFTLSERRDCFF